MVVSIQVGSPVGPGSDRGFCRSGDVVVVDEEVRVAAFDYDHFEGIVGFHPGDQLLELEDRVGVLEVGRGIAEADAPVGGRDFGDGQLGQVHGETTFGWDLPDRTWEALGWVAAQFESRVKCLGRHG